MAEIAGFALVGKAIGVLATVGLVILMSLAGAVLLRFQGVGVVDRIRREVAAGRDPGRDLAHGVMIVVAGLLLIIPGFLTDIIGLLLFIPPVRDLGWRLLRSRVHLATRVSGFRPRPAQDGGRRPPVIDLDTQDYSSTPRPESPWRRDGQ